MPTATKTKNIKKVAQKLSFAQRVEQRLTTENQWQQYNAGTKFVSGDMEEILKILATKTFPTDTQNRKAYQEAIATALTQTLSPEIGIKDFWNRMGEAGCQEVKIEDGHLNFYNKQGKIDITPYTQPIVFEIHSSFYDQRAIERTHRIEEAKRQLEELITEISRR